MIVIGTQFFVVATVYALWKIWLNQRGGFDTFITLLDLSISGLILLFSSLAKKKANPPLASNHSINPELKQFRIQILYVILLMLVGYITAIALDFAMWGLWMLGK